jgi:hypothetical protein
MEPINRGSGPFSPQRWQTRRPARSASGVSGGRLISSQGMRFNWRQPEHSTTSLSAHIRPFAQSRSSATELVAAGLFEAAVPFVRRFSRRVRLGDGD